MSTTIEGASGLVWFVATRVKAAMRGTPEYVVTLKVVPVGNVYRLSPLVEAISRMAPHLRATGYKFILLR